MYTVNFEELHWCEKGHIGIVMSGELEIDFNGKVVRYPEGAAIFIHARAWPQRQGDYAGCKAVPCRRNIANLNGV